MGKYTVLDNPLVDQRVEEHLERIVSAITSRMEPDAIILRGSFGRGEGSVMTGEGGLQFLSDFEIDVATLSPKYRSLFAELTRQLTHDSGVDVGVRWVRPDFLRVLRVGPVPVGPAPITIGLYESRYGSQILYGRDILASGPAILPEQIDPFEGVRLMLNRMAESLGYMRRNSELEASSSASHFWVTKTLLACADALLLSWGQYHFSYAERGRRFAAEAEGRLGFMDGQAAVLSELARRAYEFKLRPRPDRFLDTGGDEWSRVIPLAESVFRHLVEQVLAFSYVHSAEFPGPFLESMATRTHSLPRRQYALWKLSDAYRYVRTRQFPRSLARRVTASHFVYAVVPLIFGAGSRPAEDLPAVRSEARRWLSAVSRLGEPLADAESEWDNLRQHLLLAWRNFCY